MNLDQMIQSGVRTRAKYDDARSQRAALECIPATIAAMPLSNAKAIALLKWFKTEFFTWTNAPACSSCGEKETRMETMAGPEQPMEIEGEASRVEVYRCPKCNAQTRFPRYNNPVTLLSSRTGRCGEWANCFTLCAAACGFRARYVLDATDHVWTEVWSDEFGRWVHCDACENAFDTPMVYEAGWGKKLTYIVAFGPGRGCACDVTRRYSRRWDVDMILARFAMTTPSGVAYLQTHKDPQTCEAEEVEFVEAQRSLVPLKPEELQGRVSGSVAWRANRGETRVGVTSVVLDAGDASIVLDDVQRSPQRRGVNCVAMRANGEFRVFAFDTMHDPDASKALADVVASSEFFVVLLATHGDVKWPPGLLFASSADPTSRPFVAMCERGRLVLLSSARLELPLALSGAASSFRARFDALVASGVKKNDAVAALASELDLHVDDLDASPPRV